MIIVIININYYIKNIKYITFDYTKGVNDINYNIIK